MKPTILYTPEVGCVVECIHNDKVVTAIVEAIRSSSLYLYTSTKREIKINEHRILPWIGPCLTQQISRNESIAILQECTAKREALKAQFDIDELWECVTDELSKATVEELASLLDTEVNADYIAALGRALLDHKEYFKFSSPHFEVYSKEHYETRRTQIEAQQARQSQIEALKSIVSLATSAIQNNTNLTLETTHIDPIYRELFTHLIQAKITHTTDAEQEKLWKEITAGVHEHEHTLPLLIGQALRIIPKHYNAFAHAVGYALDTDWEEAYQDEIERLSNIEHTHSYLNIPFISIDNATTQDIDDAFYVEECSSTLYRIHFAIALPVASWDYKSELHTEVYTRATSLYLPEGTYNMLPTVLAEDIYSIRAGEKKNILYIVVDINDTADILNTEVAIATTKIEENITYMEAEERLASQDKDWLHTAHALAMKLQEKRLNNGGILITREECSLVLEPIDDDYNIRIEEGGRCGQSQLLVSELMILANTAIVSFAKKHHIPLIHRVQECSTPTGIQRIWERPEEIHSVMKMLTSVSLDVTPKRHSALGILGYATITSPLRRMVDFINEEQIFSWCIHQTPRYSEDALSASIPIIQRYTEQSLSIQRFRTRYWKLSFLKQHEDQWFQGIFVEDSNYVYIYLPIVQITVRVKHSLCGNKCILGESVDVRCIVNPIQNEISVIELR